MISARNLQARRSIFAILTLQYLGVDTGEHTVYDYTGDQLKMLRIYELRTTCLVGRDYHTDRLSWLRVILYSLDAITTIAASGAFVGLAFWRSELGLQALTWIVLAVAAGGIIRSAFRISELADQHARLAYAWKEMFLDLDSLLIEARQTGHLSEKLHIEIGFLCERFRRVESMDDIRAKPSTLAKLQQKAERQLRPEKQWLPSA